ncbi:MAG: hypothetical protein SGPRY_004112, partial [Prymnesium sp.]
PNATLSGGVLYVSHGDVLMSNGTFLDTCSTKGPFLRVTGPTMYVLGANLRYELPAPAGRWLPNSKCEISRAPCDDDPDPVVYNRCLNNRQTCKLIANPPDGECTPDLEVQPCPWKEEPFLLGQAVHFFITDEEDADFPYACGLGVLGSADPEFQQSATCAGLCPAGFRCPEVGTFEPEPSQLLASLSLTFRYSLATIVAVVVLPTFIDVLILQPVAGAMSCVKVAYRACKECGAMVAEVFLAVIGFLLAAVCTICLLSFLFHRQSYYVQMWLEGIWQACNLKIKLKILVSFYLIATVVHKVYEVEVTYELLSVLNSIYGVVSLGFNGIETVLQCLNWHGYMASLVVHMVTPAAIAVVIVIVAAITMRKRKCTLSALLETSAPYLLQLLFLAYPIVSRVAFDGFSCYKFTSGNSDKGSEEFLKADVSIECGTPKHHDVEVIASLAIAIYPVGLLVLVAMLLFAARHAICNDTPTRLSRATGFLHREYQPHLFWWELVEMLRRFVLVGLLVLYQDTMMQLIVGSLLSAMFLLLQVQASPYKEANDNLLAASVSFCLVVYFMVCTAFKNTALTNLEDIKTKLSQEQQSLYVLNVDSLGAIGMISVVGALVCSIGIFAVQLSAEIAGRRVKVLNDDERLIIDEELRRHTRVGSDRSSLTFMEKLDAARGLPHYMGVADPFGLAVDGVQRIQVEVAHFVATVRTLSDGESAHLAALKGIAKVKPNALASELTSKVVHDLEDWLEYILFQQTSEMTYSNGIRDEGRGSVSITHFLNHEKAVEANLDAAHVVALRFYTSHAFKYLNGPLRSEYFGHERSPHPLPITLTYISEGIKRLRAVRSIQQKDSQVTTLWRGMRNLELAEDFLKENRGGTEIAPMSTTFDIRVAARYGLSQHTLLFKIKVTNILQFGADLQWLSAFPSEAEVVYPPLTYLQPTGKVQVVKVDHLTFTVCEVIPNIP